MRSGGFPNGETKRAFVSGAIEAAPGFPSELLDAVAATAGREQSYNGPSLILKTAVLSETEFVTDRGRRQLAAW
ncbi:MAG: hypothetical protein ACRD6W_11265, partial [Nitrososphaerales archaeon]